MNVEEKIQKKEKRAKTRKYVIIVAIIIIVLGLVGFASYQFLVAKKDQQNTENNHIDLANNESEQIEGINNGKNLVEYKGYFYEVSNNKIYRIKNDGSQRDVIIDKISKNGIMLENLWIYKDLFYIQADEYIKTYNLDGSGEKELILVGNYVSPEFNFTKEQVFYISGGDFYLKDLNGTLIKEVNCVEGDLYDSKILKIDNTTVYYDTIVESEEGELLAKIYSLNLENWQNKEIQTEVVAEDAYMSSGGQIYQLETEGDYVYYLFGSQQGTGNFFAGSLARVKKDGTGYEKIDLSGEEGDFFEPGVIPTFAINQGILYYDGYKLNLENFSTEKDHYTAGDFIDEDNYIYTASFSDDTTLYLVKYKVGTDYEDRQTLFTQEIPEGESDDSAYSKISNFNKDYVCLSIEKKDMETGVYWTGQTLGYDNYLIKKDGSGKIDLNNE